MRDYSSLPWPAINYLVLEAGNQEDTEAIYHSAFEGIGRLVPHDFGHLVLLGDSKPDAFGRTYGLPKAREPGDTLAS